VTIPIIVIGAAAAFWGIISGNLAANQIWDEVEQKRRSEHGMFSDGEEINPVGDRRARAISEYKASNPDGEKLHKLRRGQVVTVAGMLIVLVGFFI